MIFISNVVQGRDDSCWFVSTFSSMYTNFKEFREFADQLNHIEYFNVKNISYTLLNSEIMKLRTVISTHKEKNEINWLSKLELLYVKLKLNKKSNITIEDYLKAISPNDLLEGYKFILKIFPKLKINAHNFHFKQKNIYNISPPNFTQTFTNYDLNYMINQLMYIQSSNTPFISIFGTKNSIFNKQYNIVNNHVYSIFRFINNSSDIYVLCQNPHGQTEPNIYYQELNEIYELVDKQLFDKLNDPNDGLFVLHLDRLLSIIHEFNFITLKPQTLVINQPTINQPTTNQPSINQPTTNQPSINQPSINQPTTETSTIISKIYSMDVSYDIKLYLIKCLKNYLENNEYSSNSDMIIDQKTVKKIVFELSKEQ